MEAAITLLPLDGQALPPLRLQPGGESVIGRAVECEHRLDVASVSRRHARLAIAGGGWTVEDLGSRHGTFVDGTRLEPGTLTPIGDGSIVSIGPCRFRVAALGESGQTLVSIADESTPRKSSTVRRVLEEEIGVLAKRRLDALVEVSAVMQSAAAEGEVAKAALDAAVRGTGFVWATWVRPITPGDTSLLDALGVAAAPGHETDRRLPVSRTLLTAAKDGAIVRLEDEPSILEAVSVVEGGITSALCVPVHVGREIDSFLYLATGEGGMRPPPDAAAYCAALARFCGLAVANLRRRRLEEQQKQLTRELEQARDVQRRFTPPEKGSQGELRFAVHAKPGRFVAGDICGLRSTDDGGALAYLGDVTGKGVGPGLLMASLQSFLDAVVSELALGALAAKASSHFSKYATDDRFASMWLVRSRPGSRSLEVVDAGHGMAVCVRGGIVEPIAEAAGGPPLGVVPDYPYDSSKVELAVGDRFVLVTDGVVEQRNPQGEQFGMERLAEALTGSVSPEEDVTRVLAAVTAFAQTTSFADDVTIMSMAIEG